MLNRSSSFGTIVTLRLFDSSAETRAKVTSSCARNFEERSSCDAPDLQPSAGHENGNWRTVESAVSDAAEQQMAHATRALRANDQQLRTRGLHSTQQIVQRFASGECSSGVPPPSFQPGRSAIELFRRLPS